MASRGARAHATRIEVVQALRRIARVSAATIVSTVGELVQALFMGWASTRRLMPPSGRYAGPGILIGTLAEGRA